MFDAGHRLLHAGSHTIPPNLTRGSAMTTASAPPKDVDFSFEPVPLRARRSFWSVGFVMLGFTFFSASMSVGANLGNGLDYADYLWAVMIGGLDRKSVV